MVFVFDRPLLMSNRGKRGGNGPNPKSHDNGGHDEQRTIAGDVRIVGEIQVEPTPRESLARETADHKDEARKRKHWRLEIASFGVLTIYAALTWIQSCQSIRSATAAANAATTAKDTLIIQNRPWIKYTPTIAVPLHFEPTPEIQIAFDLENTGPTIALNVIAWQELFPMDSADYFSEIHRAFAYRDSHCEAQRNEFVGRAGDVLFPKDVHKDLAVLRPDAATVRAIANQPSPLGKVAFMLVGCVTYRSSFDKTPHQTTFIYSLASNTAETGVFQPYMDASGVATDFHLQAFGAGFIAD